MTFSSLVRYWRATGSGTTWLTGGTDGALPPYDENRYRFPIGVTVLWVVTALGLLTLLVG